MTMAGDKKNNIRFNGLDSSVYGLPQKVHSAVAMRTSGNTDNSVPTATPPSTAANPKDTAVSEATTGKSGTISATIPAEHKAGSYDDIIPLLQQRMNAYRPLSDEELRKLRRRQRAEGMISGISDAVRSVANLIATHNYAPNMYDGNNSMSERTRQRFERERAQREADADKFLNYALTIGKLKDAANTAEDRRCQQDINLQFKINEDARRQAKAEHDAEVADIDLQIQLGRLSYEQGRARKMAAQARLEEEYAEHADELVLSEINRKNRANRGGGKGTHGKFTVMRTNPQTGMTEYLDYFETENSARNYAATHAEEGWVYVTTPTITTNSSTTTDQYGSTSAHETTSRRDVSTPANSRNTKRHIGW